MDEDTAVARSPPQLPIEVWQLVMDTVCNSATYSTFYTNQADYRSWALVSRAWRICAQTVLFCTVELPDAAHLYRFAALLDVAPHLVPCVRTLRGYSRDLHTHDNVIALLPAVLQLEGGLPNLHTIHITRITEQDIWHPHAARAPSDKELPYMPLDLSPSSPHSRYRHAGFWEGLEAHFVGLSELHLSVVRFETFDALAQVLHALRNLRVLSCLEVRWCALGPVPECLTWKGEGEGQGQGVFLPKLEDLTIAYMDLHGVERLLAALGRSAALKELYIDCPHYNPVSIWAPPPIDPATGTPLGIDLRAFSQLASLWLALPYTQEFSDVLRALGPVIDDVLGQCEHSHPERGGEKADPEEVEGGVSVEVCVVDKADKHEWWREEARASFARLSARGRLAVSFEKCTSIPLWCVVVCAFG
ncbi:hypothetical protein LXA43DRAFT_171651 [Ganoderma leucocontextum]|nr:hypothetical protein LXA43DRAFT_171651 [Ganoderma leucocontextum]